ncbi:alpha-ketoglutarate decarboxylase [Winogradskyella sp. PC-19]|uniref:alpha-ketoglutarate decarboxylase n=1 Tax=unclassified Winogradskyella TaxID=2615021 RepID=UPI000B3C1DD7|nr:MULTISPECIES: alpha-ketoglutarate decarboxylase [unclassified Winogradskyella]ARV09947.1 alpha-ketoglutarate decarboxylase [Winogradskyella sp. PC-19]RZN84380.1 MAG: alpha-ketoglutarate decarboxylase [Winogradskyella sp.]
MKSLLISIVFIFFSFIGFSQIENNNSFWNNVRFGGGIGLNFGNGFFSGTLAPQAVYDFNPYFSAGLGLTGSYSSQKDVFNSTILGGSVIALTNPFPELQLSVELEQVNVNTSFEGIFSSNERDNFWATALFLGAGYRTGNVTFGVRYDVLYDEDESIYADPWLPFVRFWF